MLDVIINDDHLKKVLKEKAKQAKAYTLPHKIPNRVVTIEAKEKISIIQWFNYIYYGKPLIIS